MSESSIAVSLLETPSFTIGAASNISGISETTLRVWERRYRFPQATRSPGGHRHYSQRDVIELRWVKAQMDAGMRASRAIRERTLMAWDVAEASALREPITPGDAPDPASRSAQTLLLNALLAYDSARALETLDVCVARSSVSSVVRDIIGPTLSAVGAAWADGEADVAAEHFATNVLRHQLLKWMQASPPSYLVRPVALACAPGELHEGSLLMLGVLLRQLRWPVVYLGQSLPLADLGAFIQRAQPELVVFVAMSGGPALALAEWPRWLTKSAESPPPLIGYGGRAFTKDPALVERIPGALLGLTVDEGSQRIDRIMLHRAVLKRSAGSHEA